MDYVQSVSYIHSLLRFGISPGLERISALTDELGRPQDALRFVHVAGTNGKGTTSTEISEVTKAAGLKTGLFTSPYVIDFRERMQINNEYISETALADIVTRIKAVVEKISSRGIFPTEFETITAAGLLYFAESSCDIVVLECGMGGAHDSTNVIGPPLVSVFTSISLDHMKMLGDTVEKIAAEKSGIIKPGCIAVSYPEGSGSLGFTAQSPEAAKQLKLTAERSGCPLYFASADGAELLSESITGSVIRSDGLTLSVPFMGAHQAANALTAAEACRRLRDCGTDITDKNITDGIGRAAIPARMEKLGEKPLILLDGGHNRGCAEAVSGALKKHLSGKRIVALVGLMADKECETALSMILPLCSCAVFTTPRNPRSCPAAELMQAGRKYCGSVFAEDDSKKALEKALSLTGSDDVLFICGSFYLAAEVRPLLLNAER